MKTRKMKDSGVEWLGSVPEGWQIDRIGSFYTHRNEKVSDKDYPPLSVTMKGIVPQLETAAKTDDGDNRKLVRKGDFAINSRSDRRGSCGISAYEGSVSLINTILAPRGVMSPEYYNWLFHTAAFADEFYKWGHGIVDDLWSTRWSEMKRIAITYPPLPEQRAIAAYLDERCAKIDTMIAEAKETIEEYKQWKQSLIFEAVTGKVGVGERCRCRKMRDSGVEWLGNVPEEWKVCCLKYLCSMQAGKTISSEEILEEGPYPVYGGNGLRGYYSEFNYKGEYALIGRQGALCGNVHFVNGHFWATEHALVTSPCEKVELLYLYWLLVAMDLNRYVSQTAAQPGLAASVILNVKTVLPPLPEQWAIAAYLDRKCAAIDRVVAEKEGLIADLEQYKKSLIFGCVTGKREVA